MLSNLTYTVYDGGLAIPRGQSLKRNEPLNLKSIKQLGEPETKRTAELEKYQAEPEKKRVAKMQRYWKSFEPGCLANRVRYGEAKIYTGMPSKKNYR